MSAELYWVYIIPDANDKNVVIWNKKVWYTWSATTLKLTGETDNIVLLIATPCSLGNLWSWYWCGDFSDMYHLSICHRRPSTLKDSVIFWVQWTQTAKHHAHSKRNCLEIVQGTWQRPRWWPDLKSLEMPTLWSISGLNWIVSHRTSSLIGVLF